MTDGNGWQQWKNLVLSTMERIEHEVKERDKRYEDNCNIIQGRILEMEKAIAELKVKNGIFSVVAGIVSALITAIVTIWRLQ